MRLNFDDIPPMFLVNWTEMKRLVFGLESGWESIKKDVETFLAAL